MKSIIIVIAGLFSIASAQDTVGKRPVPVAKFKVWVEGKQIDASLIDVDCVEDDLASTANFRYILKDSTGVQLAQGYIKMTGADYVQYSTQNNHAQRGTNWVLQQLNLARRAQVQSTQAARQAAAGTAPKQ
jgi:hypothetical protein